MPERIDAKEFLELVRPALTGADPQALAKEVCSRWQAFDLCQLLDHGDVNVRRVVALVLGMVGDMSVNECLARALWDEDEQVNEMAQHSLWSIWFRSSDVHAAEPFRAGVSLLESENYPRAVEMFEQAIAIDPQYAEAHNQCGIAYYFMGEWQNSIDCCMHAVEIIPQHFGAIGGIGHCYAQLGNLDLALRYYRQALKINPRMPAIARTAQRIENCLSRRKDDSGQFMVDKLSV